MENISYVIDAEGKSETREKEEDAIRLAISWLEFCKRTTVWEVRAWKEGEYSYTKRRCVYADGKRILE